MSHDEEPLCFGFAEIVEFLQRHNRPGFASMVRRVGEDLTSANLRERRLIDWVHELRAKYEPRERHEAVSFQPPPEASD